MISKSFHDLGLTGLLKLGTAAPVAILLCANYLPSNWGKDLGVGTLRKVVNLSLKVFSLLRVALKSPDTVRHCLGVILRAGDNSGHVP